MRFRKLLKTLLASLAIAGVGASSAATFAYVSKPKTAASRATGWTLPAVRWSCWKPPPQVRS